MAFEKSVDKLWNRLKNDLDNGILIKEDWNYPAIEKIMDQEGIESFWRKEIFCNFFWELSNIKRQPTRNLEWVDGEHAMLYDTYVCKDCGCIIHTRDDIEECFAPVFCPVCNPSQQFIWAYDPNDGSEQYKQQFNFLMNMKEYHRKRHHWFWKHIINLKINSSIFYHKTKRTILCAISKKHKQYYEERMKQLFG